jgi:uncharacterized protein YrrD
MVNEARARDARFEIRRGAPVVSTDREVGRVEHLVVSPATGAVTGLVVRKGRLLHRDVVIPIEAVEDATDELVRVRLSADQLHRLPAYHEEAFTRAAPDWQSPTGRRPEGILFRLPVLPAHLALQPARSGQTEAAVGGQPLMAGQQVACGDDEIGPVDLVLLDSATRRATHFVVRRGEMLDRDTIVPLDWVRAITRDKIVLNVTREQLDRLPEYLPDDEITSDVLDTLWYRGNLDHDDVRDVEVRTRDGIVELNGITRTRASRAAVEAIVRGVRGVLGVRNNLQSFEALAEATRARA